MKNKYDLNFSADMIEKNFSRLINQTWKLIPMRENDEDWEKQLNTVLIEIVGLSQIFLNCPQFLQLLSKIEGLRISYDIDFAIYRRTIFEIISLLQELKKYE